MMNDAPEIPSGIGRICINEEQEIYGGPMDGKKISYGIRLFGSKDVLWWGRSQWYKWRWNITHIDLGIISVYNLKCYWFWRIVSILVWPMRKFYHRFYVYKNR